ncbi:hypothetical protein Tco_1498642 [Tanacetum coccineum]
MSRPTRLKRLKKVSMSKRVESSKDQESLGTPEDASKQGRSIEDIDVDVDVSLVDETQERQNDDLTFDSGVLEDDAIHVEAKVDGKDEHSKKPDDSNAGEAVNTASIDDSVVLTTSEEITLAQTLIQIKEVKPKVVTTAATTTTTTRPKDRRVVVQDPIPLKRRDQIALDEQIARDVQAKLDVELIAEQKLARKQEEANIGLIESWENTQAMIKADRLLAERLQLMEREELIDEEKEKLFMELIEKRRKHFAVLRAQEKRNRPPTKAQKRTQMKAKKKRKKVEWRQLKAAERNCSEGKEQRKNNTELKKLLVIKKGEDISIDAIPLATKLPVIIDYKLYKEGMMVHYQLIRADGSSKRYSSMIRMLQGIDKEDLEALWRIVKEKYGDTRPDN